jgi:hypothetical protein
VEVIEPHRSALFAAQPIHGLRERQCALSECHESLDRVDAAGRPALGERAPGQLQPADVYLYLQEDRCVTKNGKGEREVRNETL